MKPVLVAVIIIALFLGGGLFLEQRAIQSGAQGHAPVPGTTYVVIPLGAGQNRTLPSQSSTLRGQGYEPDVVTVVIGVNNTVKWVNEDSDVFLGLTVSVPHTITNPQGAFDSGLLATGDTFTHVFTTPGTYYYHCDYHPWQKGWVVVKS
jgi:plastocyanin